MRDRQRRCFAERMVSPRSARTPDRIPLPSAPQERRRREFPLLATAAPVVGSLVMWGVTGSAFALVFAFLGPVVAVGSMIDERRHSRRTSRAEALRFGTDVEAVLLKIRAAQQNERLALLSRVLQPQRALNSLGRNPEWWRQDWKAAIPVCLGMGPTPSSVALEAAPGTGGPDVEAAYDMLAASAATLDGPIVIDARDGVGIVGPRIPARALARSIVAQLAFLLSPAEWAAEAGGDGCFGWTSGLPHPRGARDSHSGRMAFRPTGDAPGPAVVCVVADDLSEVPRECRVLVRLTGAATAVVERNPSAASGGEFRPWFVSETEAAALAAHAKACAQADGLARVGDRLPESIALSELEPAETISNRLASVFSVGAEGRLVVDLVRDGPHAVIGGMTGSGKSELLVSWVLAMATTCSPAEVNFLLVDFKGGASFAPVRRLPHTVGLITDLDEVAARRALTSLRAELRHRERVLAAAGARSLDELPEGERMPRLVVMVDEFAVVVNEFPDLQALFADLAGRGRSLGIHLILCTQRPAGVIRDAVLSNCSLRLSLRVNNGADSTAVVGTPAAAELPARPHGRCLLSIGGKPPVEVQVALATASDVEAVIARHQGPAGVTRRPWCDPLPPSISLDVVGFRHDQPGIGFGLSDVPEQQSQPPAVFDPGRDGNLVVFGGLGSGKSGVLAAMQAASERQARAVVRIPDDVEGAWDVVSQALAESNGSGTKPVLYLLDDLDILLGRFSGDHLSAFLELMTRLLRESSADRWRTVFTASRFTPGIQQLAAACDSRIILRMPNRQEHLLAGGDAADYSDDLVPGSGTWRGHRLQIAHSPIVPVVPPGRTPWPVPAGAGFALVAPAASAIAARIRAAHPPTTSGGLQVIDIAGQADSSDIVTITGHTAEEARVVIGDPGEWQARWSMFAAVRASGPVVFTGCSVAEFRSLTGIRRMPPPIGPSPGGAWILTRDGSVRRVQLPDWRAAVPTTW
jgi:S-DNA-T family DNA segregation ATPase FtsK/SpoIIIE